MGNTASFASSPPEYRRCVEVFPRKATQSVALTKLTVLSKLRTQNVFNDPGDSEKEYDVLAPWTTVLSNDHIDESFLYQSPDGEWVPFEHSTKVTNIVAVTHRPVHAAKVQNFNCAKYKTALRTYPGLSPKHAEEISAGKEDEAVADVYGDDSLTTANTVSSVENAKGIPELGSQLPVSPPELWGPAVWKEWYTSIERSFMETAQERALRILDEPRKGPIGLSLVDAYCLHYIDNFLTPEAVLHIRTTVSRHLMDRNKRKIDQSKRRRNIVSPPRYRPSPLSACFLPGSFEFESDNVEENTEEDEEELDSDRPIAMIFSRRGTRLEMPKFDEYL
ncbi:hypothetical protein DFH11DRAFT_1168027 [Phellopilus nigrolimitatus]|nr:hypothetical protein DFH11DRAFT_1168027 [Phellopilus nigrolimitatus]